MLARFAPNFVISRVIQNSYLAEAQTVGLLKVPFGSFEDYFTSIDPQNFEVLSR
jgi:hypothetical protein